MDTKNLHKKTEYHDHENHRLVRHKNGIVLGTLGSVLHSSSIERETAERQILIKKVQVGKDQEKVQSEKDSHSKNRGGKTQNQQSGTDTKKTFRKPNEQLFSQ